MKKTERTIAIILMLTAGLLLSGSMLAAQTVQDDSALKALEIYSIKAVSGEAGRVYALIDGTATTYAVNPGNATGVYLTASADVGKLTVDVATMDGVGALTVEYMANGRLEREGVRYVLHQGTNTLLLRHFVSGYVVLHWELTGTVREIRLYGTLRSQPLQQLTYTVAAKFGGDVDQVNDGDVDSDNTFYKFYVTPNGLTMSAEGTVSQVRFWGKVHCQIRIKGKQADGTYVTLVEGIDGGAFDENGFTAIDIADMKGIAYLGDLQIELYNFKGNSAKIHEIELWGQGARQSGIVTPMRGSVTGTARYAIDGFRLSAVSAITGGDLTVTSVSGVYVFLNFDYLGYVPANGTKTFVVEGSDLRGGFNLVEYYSHGNPVSVSGATLALRYGVGTVGYRTNWPQLNDGDLSTGVAAKTVRLLLDRITQVDRVTLFGTGTVGSTVKVQIDGKIAGSLVLTAADVARGYVEIPLTTTNRKRAVMVTVEGLKTWFEIEVRGSRLHDDVYRYTAPSENGQVKSYDAAADERQSDVADQQDSQPQPLTEDQLAALQEQLTTGIGQNGTADNETVRSLLADSAMNRQFSQVQKCANHYGFGIFESYIRMLLKDQNRPVPAPVIRAETTVKEDFRILTVEDPAGNYRKVSLGSDEAVFVNGAADIPLFPQPGDTDLTLVCTKADGTATTVTATITRQLPIVLGADKPYLDATATGYDIVLPDSWQAVYYRYDNGNGMTWAENGPLPYTKTGVTSVHVTIDLYDTAGNKTRYDEILAADTTPPVIASVTGPTGWTSGSVGITVTASDTGTGIALIEVLDGATVCGSVTIPGQKQTTQTLNLTFPTDGKRTLTIRVTDRMGNASTATLLVQIDSTAAHLALPQGEIYTNANPYLLSFTITDLSVKRVKINGDDQVLGSLVTNATPGADGTIDGNGTLLSLQCAAQVAVPIEGDNVISVWVEDKAGNVAIEGITVVRDTTPPAITLMPLDGAYNTQTLQLTGTVADSTTVSVSINGASATVSGQGSSQSFMKWIAFTTEGVNSFTIVATDRAGNSTTLTQKITWDTTAPGMVENLTARYDGAKTRLDWTAPSADTASYRIVRRIVHLDDYGLTLAEETADPVETTNTWYEDTAQPAQQPVGESVWYADYTVYAIDSVGNVSIGSTRSNKECATTSSSVQTDLYSTNNEAHVIVPAGALETTQTIAVGVSKDNKDGTGVVLNLEPEGTEFTTAVEVKVRCDELVQSGIAGVMTDDEKSNLKLYYFDDETGEWVEQGGSYDAATDTFVGQIQHFSTYKIALPDFNPTLANGIVSTNNYFQFNNEFVDEASGTLYVQRNELTLQSGNNLSFSLTGLFSSAGVDLGVAPVNQYFGYMIPYIKNGYVYLENGARYKLFWTADNTFTYNKDTYFEAKADPAGKMIVVKFKNGQRYVFNGAGYFKSGATSGNLYLNDVVMPLQYITDRTGKNRISFFYTDQNLSSTDLSSGKLVSKKLTGKLLTSIKVYINGDFTNQIKTVTFGTTVTPLKICGFPSCTVISKITVSSPGVTSNDVAVFTNNGLTLSRPHDGTATRTVSFTIVLDPNDENKTAAKSITIDYDEGGSSTYNFSLVDCMADTGTTYKRSMVTSKVSKDAADGTSATLEFGYMQTYNEVRGSFSSCTITYKDGAGTIVKIIKKEFSDLFVRSVTCKPDGTKISEDVTIKDKGTEAFVKANLNTMMTTAGEYLSYDKSTSTYVFQSKTLYDALIDMKNNKLYLSGYTIAKNSSSITLTPIRTNTTGMTVTISSAKTDIHTEKPGTTANSSLNVVNKNGKITRVSGDISGDTLSFDRTIVPFKREINSDTTHVTHDGDTVKDYYNPNSVILESGTDTFGSISVKYDIVLEVLGNDILVFKRITPETVVDENGEKYTASITDRVKGVYSYSYETSDSSTPVMTGSTTYTYDEYGSVCKVNTNGTVNEYANEYSVFLDPQPPKIVTAKPNTSYASVLPIRAASVLDSFMILTTAVATTEPGATQKYTKSFQYNYSVGQVYRALDYGYIDKNIDISNTLSVTTDRITTLSYDSCGRLIAQTNPAGGSQEFAYDSGNPYFQPTTITQKYSDGTIVGITTVAYDRLHDIATSTTIPQGQTTGYEYYPDGDLKTISGGSLDYFIGDTGTTPLAVKTQYFFGANTVGVVVTKNAALDSAIADARSSFKTGFADASSCYTAFDTMVRSSAGVTSIVEASFYNFDGLGHIVTITQFNYEQNAWTTHAIDITYDSLGNRTAISYPSGKTLNRTFDALGRITSVFLNGTENGSTVTKKMYGINYQWNTITNLSTNASELLYRTQYVQYPYTASNTDRYYTNIFTDKNGREQFYELYKNTTLLTNKVNQYNPLEQLTRETETGTNANGTVSYGQTYAYTTDFGQVSKVDGPQLTWMEPSVSGNSVIEKTVTAAKEVQKEYNTLGLETVEKIPMTIDGANKTLQTKTDYTDFGNPSTVTLHDGSTQYAYYDACQQLVKKTDVDNQSEYYLYDTAGRLVAKRGKNIQSWTYYLYAPNGQIAAEIGWQGLDFTFNDPYIQNGQIATVNPQFTLTLDSNWRQYAVFKTYDKMGRVIGITDRKNNTVSYEYDVDGQVAYERLTVSGKTPIQTAGISYDLFGRKTAVVNKDNLTAITTYTDWGLVYQEKVKANEADASGEVRTVKEYVYDDSGNVTLIRTYDGATAKTVYTASYDGLGRKLSEQGEDGVLKSYTLRGDGTIASVKIGSATLGDSRPTISYMYNRLGQVTKLNRMGIVSYSTVGYTPLTIDNKNVTNFTAYDAQPTETPNFYAVTKSVLKNTAETLFAVRPDGSYVVPSLTYNTNISTDTDHPLYVTVNQTQYFANKATYNAFVADPSSVTVGTGTYEYVQSMLNPDGLPINAKTETGDSTSFTYNRFNEITQKADTISGSTYVQDFEWNAQGQLAYQSVAHDIGVGSPVYAEYTYDGTMNFTGVTGVQTVSYNDFMMPGTVAYANGITESYVYDGRFRLSTKVITKGQNTLLSQVLSYNANGKIETITETGSALNAVQSGLTSATKTYDYTGFGQLLKAQYALPVKQTITVAATTTSDSPITFESHDFHPTVSPDNADYAGFSGGNLKIDTDSAQQSGNSTTDPAYTGWGQNDTTVTQNGVTTVNGNWRLDASNNSLVMAVNTNKVTEIGFMLKVAGIDASAEWQALKSKLAASDYEVWIQESSGAWQKLTADQYIWTVDFGVIRIAFAQARDLTAVKVRYLQDIKSLFVSTTINGSTADIQLSITDLLGDEPKALPNGTGYIATTAASCVQEFEYDSLGNMTKKTTTYDNSRTVVETFTYSTLTGRLLSDSSYLYEYDDCGNLKNKKAVTGSAIVQEYQYNLKQKMVQVKTYRDGQIFNSGMYVYDALGNRTTRSYAGNDMEAVTELSVYDMQGNKVYEETWNNGQKLAAYFLMTFALLTTARVKIGSTDADWFVRKASITAKKVINNFVATAITYQYFDYLGSKRLEANGSGNLTAVYDHLPFGERAYEWKAENAPETDTTWAYYDYDNESQLYYARARYYNPQTSSFLSEDVLQWGNTWYGYCEGDPVNFVDINGASPTSVLQLIAKYREYILLMAQMYNVSALAIASILFEEQLYGIDGVIAKDAGFYLVSILNKSVADKQSIGLAQMQVRVAARLLGKNLSDPKQRQQVIDALNNPYISIQLIAMYIAWLQSELNMILTPQQACLGYNAGLHNLIKYLQTGQLPEHTNVLKRSWPYQIAINKALNGVIDPRTDDQQESNNPNSNDVGTSTPPSSPGPSASNPNPFGTSGVMPGATGAEPISPPPTQTTNVPPPIIVPGPISGGFPM